nr:response regulator transcription factor [Hoyosella altamirensis]
MIRAGLVSLLQEFGHDVVAEAGDGESFVDAVTTYKPDVSIVDVRMPPSFTDEGLQASVRARAQVSGTPIMILSQYVEVSYADDLLADTRGGVGYLLKDRVMDVEDFLESLQRVASGGTVFDPEVVAQLMVRRRKDDPVAALTTREREVLALMAEGRSNRSIGRLLVISDGAVEKHIRNIFTKLNLRMEDDNQHRRVKAVLTYLSRSA